jgi:hypothetical protein
MADSTHKPIAAVKVGDQVLATDPATGRTQAQPVVALIAGDGAKHLVEITVDTGHATGTVIATDGHPFWVDDHGGWINADNLRPGDELRTPDGQTLEVVSARTYTQHRRVHNLAIDGIHTYYVAAGGQDLLVHNCAAGDYGVPRQPGVYAIHFNDGSSYVGSTIDSMHRRVDRAFGDEGHAVFQAGLTPQDISHVQHWAFPNLAEQPMRRVEQLFIDHFRNAGRTMLNRKRAFGS